MIPVPSSVRIQQAIRIHPPARRLALAATGLCLLVVALRPHPAAAQDRPPPEPVTMRRLTTAFNNPIGIDHHEPSGALILSVNYGTGLPHNLELVQSDGRHVRFSGARGYTDELKIATVHASTCTGGFTVGEVFTGDGRPGSVVRISADGAKVQRWVRLPGESGLMRGSLFQDKHCVFGGDLVVATTTGGVWRVSSKGVARRLANLGTHLEGLYVLPDDPLRYGPWAGKILVGAEEQTRLYAIDPKGKVLPFSLGIATEDIDVVPARANFYGVDFAEQRLVGAEAEQWADKEGDVIIAQESGQLWDLRWNPQTQDFDTVRIAQVGQWEHVTFSTAGVVEIPTPTPVTATPTDTPVPPTLTATPPKRTTATATASPSPTPSDTPSPIPTETATSTATRTATSIPTDSPTPTSTTTPSATATPSPRPRPIYLPMLLDQRCASKPLAIALVLDASTSMARPLPEGGSKLAAAQAAARAFLDGVALGPGQARVALVGFNRRAWPLQDLTADRAQLDAAIAALPAGMAEGTRLDLALDAGAAALAGDPDAEQLLILLTDGLPNGVPTPAGGGSQEDVVREAAARARASGATLYTVGLGDPLAADPVDRIDPVLLADIAGDPARSFTVNAAAHLREAYAGIAARLRCLVVGQWGGALRSPVDPHSGAIALRWTDSPYRQSARGLSPR